MMHKEANYTIGAVLVLLMLSPASIHAYDAELFRTDWQVRELSTAIRKGNLEGVKQAIERDVELNYSGSSSPLHQAVFEDQHDIVILLLSSGAQVDQTDSLDRTPLYDAAIYGRLEIANTLIQYGAEVDVIAGNYTPLSIASQNGHADVISALLENGAKPNRKVGLRKAKAIHFASANGHTDSVRLLLDAGAEVNGLDHRSSTPLHEALTGGTASRNLDVIRLLLQRGADPNIMNDKGQSPRSIIDQHPGYYQKLGITELFEPYRE